MRTLTIDSTNFPLTEDTAARLLKVGSIYECGGGHDLHLTPDHHWTLISVESIVLAIYAGAIAEQLATLTAKYPQEQLS